MARLKSKAEEIKGNLNQKYWVQKSDPLVLMRSVPFSLGELKVLDTYISRINSADDSQTTVIFTKEEYEELMGISKINAEVLKKHAEGLLGKIVTLEMPDKSFLKFVLFTAAYYHLDDCGVPIIELSCSPQAKNLFFCIGKYHYFKYALENIVNLNRKSSYLLYLHIVSNRYRCEWEIDLSELRDNILDCKGQESYQAFKEFKRTILDSAVKEVNQKTDCHFEYQAIKRGRKVVKIKFIYHSMGHQIEETVEAPLSPISQPSLFDDVDYGSELANLFGSAACDDEFTPEQIRVIQDLVIRVFPYSTDHMAMCDYLIGKIHKMDLYDTDRKTIKNRFSYLCTMIEKDIAD